MIFIGERINTMSVALNKMQYRTDPAAYIENLSGFLETADRVDFFQVAITMPVFPYPLLMILKFPSPLTLKF